MSASYRRSVGYADSYRMSIGRARRSGLEVLCVENGVSRRVGVGGLRGGLAAPAPGFGFAGLDAVEQETAFLAGRELRDLVPADVRAVREADDDLFVRRLAFDDVRDVNDRLAPVRAVLTDGAYAERPAPLLRSRLLGVRGQAD